MHKHTPNAMIFNEIITQAIAWRELMPIVMRQGEAFCHKVADIDEVLFIGCGSALNISYSAAVIFQSLTGKRARAVPAAELTYFPNSVLTTNNKTLAVLTSRSGKTSEIIQALDYLKGYSIPTMSVTCHEDSLLAKESDLCIDLTPVLERAVPTTRSVTGMLISFQLLASKLAGNMRLLDEVKFLPDICHNLMTDFHQQGEMIGNRSDIVRYAFVGNGPYLGMARECQLKIKEMTLQPSDSYPVFDFRHGPQSTVDEHMLLTVMLSDSARLQEIAFIRDMKELGGNIWVICDRSDKTIEESADYILELKSGLSEWARIPLYMPAIHFMAYYRALSLGLDPDQPNNLAYWIDLSH